MLSDNGVCYLVLIKENKPKEIQQILLKNYQLKSEVKVKASSPFPFSFTTDYAQIIISRRAVNEELMIMKISHC